MYNSNKFEIYNNKGLSGLVNLGNTCYINSCMQVLSNCYELNEKINNISSFNNNDDAILLKEWLNLKELMWSKNCVISPNRFINYIQKISRIKGYDLFSGFAQNDLPEFLNFIINCFHNSIKREVKMNIVGKVVNEKDYLAKECYNMIKNMYEKEYSELLDYFFGTHVSYIESLENKNVISCTCEPFCNLSLPIPEKSLECSIYDCLNLYINKELLSGENSYFNEKTNSHEDVYKCLNFWSFPKILIVDFKRFTNNNKKKQTLITTPIENLNLTDYIIGYDKYVYVYDLFAIINHSGNCYGGHYTAFIKNANNKWYHYNDTSVKEIDKSQIITTKAYCYFYLKR